MVEKNDTFEFKKKTLSRFPRLWLELMILYVSANLLTMFNSGVGRVFPVLALFLCGMIVGLSLMLKRKSYGFWILLVSSAMITTMNGTGAGGFTLISSGGLVLVFLSWLFTRKQIDYRFWKKANGD